MKDTKKADALEKRIDELTTKNDAEIKETREKLAEAQRQLVDAQLLMKQAEEEANAERFKSVKATIDDLTEVIKWYEKIIEKKQSEPMITAEEYRRGLADIMEEHDKNFKKDRARALKLIGELKEIMDAEEARTEYENRVLKRWQAEIFKDKDRTANPLSEKQIRARPFNNLYWLLDKKNPFVNLEKFDSFEELQKVICQSG